MNIEDVDSTIAKLEEDDTTFENCEKLASLYIVREYYLRSLNEPGNEVEDEIKDILPQYKKYVELKKKYQLSEISEKPIENSIKLVCKEIEELIRVLYRCTDMPIEREYIKKMLNNLADLC